MTLPQGLAFAVIIGMMGLFVWGRLRYDVVAMLALCASVLVGIVPAEDAFSGFSDDIVIIVGSALLVSAAVARSGIVEMVLHRIGPYLTSPRKVIVLLVGSVTLMAGFVKNIGALAMLMPVAFQLARRTKTSPSYFLMPMAFGSLLGGTMTMIGTSPNIIVSRMRAEIVGEPFRMFDFTPVGFSIAVIGVAFLAFGYKLLPAGRKGAPSPDAAFNLKNYTTEASVPDDSPMVGKTVAELEKYGEGDVQVVTVIRERFRRFTPSPSWVLAAEDVLLLEGESAALEQVVARGKLKLGGGEEETTEADTPAEDFGVMEAVVTADSPLVGRTPTQARLAERFQIALLAVSRSGERVTRRLGPSASAPATSWCCRATWRSMPEALGELRCLPLAGRNIGLGQERRAYLPILVLAAAMVLVALQVVPVAFGFFGAALVLILARSISLREAYEAVDWPLLVLIGSLIPVSEAMQTTGATDILATWLSFAAAPLAAYRRARAHHGCRHGGDAVPEQRGDRAGDGADRGAVR